MTERLLQFIWQFQYFSKNELCTVTDEPLRILIPGQCNSNQGPDFSGARIRIGKTTWAGSVELHVKTSDWNKHKHPGDPNYNNVVLHVVWEHDGDLNHLPVLELQNRVPKILLQRFEEWMHSSSFIPCGKSIAGIPELTWKSWKDRLLAERLLRKAAAVECYLQENNFHWEESFWWLLARNFGAQVNAAAFEEMARTLPVQLLAKHKSQIQQLEAMLLGQAGLLKKKQKDDYYNLLQREYKFLKEKYKLKPIHQPVHFLRMRPGNFPGIRLAQLAALIQNSAHLFSMSREIPSVKDLRKLFDVTANDYWHYHYQFGKTSPFKRKNLGIAMVDSVIINTVCPVLFAYGHYHHDQQYKSKALTWLEKTAAESNSITRGFGQLGVDNKNAFDSQALIELKNEYCSKKRCLECAVGNAILKTT
jgi:hypothetical protein